MLVKQVRYFKNLEFELLSSCTTGKCLGFFLLEDEIKTPTVTN